MNPRRRIVLTGLLAAGTQIAFAHSPSGASSTLVTQTLTIGGRVQHRLTLTVEGLRGFPAQTMPEIPIKGRSGETVRILKGYTGARLIDVLDKAVLVADDHNDLKKTIIIATASDDYKAVFSWGELYNTSVGEGVLVLYTSEGKPLGDEEGRIALISTKDSHTGPRHVRWLKDVQVQKII